VLFVDGPSHWTRCPAQSRNKQSFPCWAAAADDSYMTFFTFLDALPMSTPPMVFLWFFVSVPHHFGKTRF
jgi:hypothetical protein